MPFLRGIDVLRTLASKGKFPPTIMVTIYPLDGEDMETLVNKADSAMYRIKKSGKGGYRYSSDPVKSSAS